MGGGKKNNNACLNRHCNTLNHERVYLNFRYKDQAGEGDMY